MITREKIKNVMSENGNRPASGNMTLRFFTSSSMKLKEIPHSLAKDTTTRSTHFTINSVSKKSLYLSTVWI